MSDAQKREYIEEVMDYLDKKSNIEIYSAGETTELGQIVRRHEVVARALLRLHRERQAAVAAAYERAAEIADDYSALEVADKIRALAAE